MPALTMKETPKAASLQQKRSLKTKFVACLRAIRSAWSRGDGQDSEDWFQGEIDTTGNATSAATA